MAGFYVAQGLGLNSRNMTVSHRDFPVENALELAAFDLHTNKPPMTLVGAVDQCAFPPDQHRKRLGLAADTEMAEGSHWLLIGGFAQQAVGRCLDITYHPNREALLKALERSDVSGSCEVAAGRNMDEPDTIALQQRLDKPVAGPPSGYHDTLSGFTIASFLASGQPGRELLHVSKSAGGKYAVAHLQTL
jgi:hypothetical protein